MAVMTAAIVCQPSPAAAAADRLRITFESEGGPGARLTASSSVSDVSGQGNNGKVVTAYNGAVTAVAGSGGTAADFPGKCSAEPCPNALIQISDDGSLDPGTADFEWGARILLKASETDDGENVVQKGTWGQAGGQWKLQVDKTGGRPSCVVSGTVPSSGKDLRVVLKSTVGVADGAWHQVTCRRTAAGVTIVVDGQAAGSAAMARVTLASSAPVTIGAKSVKPTDNDQFHGVLDDVFMALL
jgi:hypothetical protein